MKEKVSEIKRELKKKLKTERYEHTLRVAAMCQALAMRYEYDLDRAELAGLLHDCARVYDNDELYKKCVEHEIPVSECEKNNPVLLHAKYGVYLAREKYEVEDQEILEAICYHTTGRLEMSILEKIVYIADYIEPGRDKAPNLHEIRKMAFLDLDKTMYLILRDTLEYLNWQGKRAKDPMTENAFHYYRTLMGLD